MAKKSPSKRKGSRKEVSIHEAILSLRTKAEVETFLGDVLSSQEKERVDLRWAIWLKLQQNDMSGKEIAEDLDCCQTTVTRALKTYREGNGMVEKMINRRLGK